MTTGGPVRQSMPESTISPQSGLKTLWQVFVRVYRLEIPTVSHAGICDSTYVAWRASTATLCQSQLYPPRQELRIGPQVTFFDDDIMLWCLYS
jgi:hypothetical protein